MRIISGILKGKKIDFLRNSNTRPLKDSVKESIFNILKHSNEIKVDIEGANILDLYSGIGSFGLECISRGAKKVTFVEKDKKALYILQKNLEQNSILHKASIFNDNIESYLKKCEKKFKIFFFDPPFADKDFRKNLNLIKKYNLYEKNHIIIVHREKKSDDKLENHLSLIKNKQYGRSKIIFGKLN